MVLGNKIIGLVLILLFLAPSMSMLSIAQGSGDPTISISPTTVEQGYQLFINVTGFPANATVNIYLNNATWITSIITGQNGNATGYVVIPITIPPGEYEVEAYSIYGNETYIAISPNNLTVEPSTSSELSSYSFKVYAPSTVDIGANVTAYLLLEKNGIPVDSNANTTPTCELIFPSGTVDTLPVVYVTTGVYKTSFIPNINGTYLFACRMPVAVNGVTYELGALAPVYASPLTNQISQSTSWIVNNITENTDSVLTKLDEVNGTLYAEIQTQSGIIQSNLSDAKVFIYTGFQNMTDLINTKAQWIVSIINFTSDKLASAIGINFTIAFAEIESVNHTVITGVSNLTSLLDSMNVSTANLIQTAKGDIILSLLDSEHNIRTLINLTRDNLTMSAYAGFTNLSDLVNQNDNWIIGNITLESGKLANLMYLYNDSLTNVLINVNNTVLRGEANLTSLLDSMNVSTANLIQTAKGDIILSLLDSEHNIRTLINLTRDNLTIELSNAKGQILGLLNSNYNNLMNTMLNINNTMSNLVLHAENNITGTLSLRISTAENSIASSISSAKSDVIQEIDLGNSQLQSIIITSKGDIIANISTSYGNLMTTLGNIRDLINSKSNVIINAINSKSEELQGSIIGVVNQDYNNILNKINGVDDLIGSVQQSLYFKSDNNTKRILDELSVIEGLNGKVNKTLVEILLGIDNKVDSKGDIILSALNGNYQKVDQKLDNMNLIFNTKLGSINTTLNDDTAKLEYLINTSKGDIIGVIKTSHGYIIANLTKVNNNVKDTAKLVEDKSNELGNVSKQYGGTATIASIVTLLAVSGLAIFMRKK